MNEPIIDDDVDSRIAFAQIWEELDPKLQRSGIVLRQKDGNLVAVARTLRIHRNTAGFWLKKIESLLKKHGFGGD